MAMKRPTSWRRKVRGVWHSQGQKRFSRSDKKWERRVLAIVARFLLCGDGQLAGRAQLWCRVLWWIVDAGPSFFVVPVCGETQEKQLSEVSRETLRDLECR